MNAFRKLGALALSALTCAVIGTTVTVTPASALSSPQTVSSGTANFLKGDLDNFWRANYRNWGWTNYRTPTVHYYNTTVQACGTTLSPNNSYACRSPYLWNIWFGTGWNQSLLNRYGDYAPGVILAHEWGHAVMYSRGWTSRTGTLGSELFADCLAGMYTHYGLLVSRKLDNSDYWEGYHTLRAIAGGTHGTADQRSAWYQYGYTSYNINSCYRALT